MNDLTGPLGQAPIDDTIVLLDEGPAVSTATSTGLLGSTSVAAFRLISRSSMGMGI